MERWRDRKGKQSEEVPQEPHTKKFSKTKTNSKVLLPVTVTVTNSEEGSKATLSQCDLSCPTCSKTMVLPKLQEHGQCRH